MTAIVWDQPSARTFESGLDRGVLYVEGEDGVAWNGLLGLNEKSGNKANPVYFDGIKINDIVTIGDFSGSLKAITYPDEFLPCEGILEDQTGVYVTEQPPKRFGLCYRTQIGDGVDQEIGYKIHLLYNLTAIPNTKSRKTLSLDVEPYEFEWNLTAIPEVIEGYRATTHFIIDSRSMDPWLLGDLEDILYGDATNNPRLPSLKSLMAFIRKWNRLIIVDHGDGTWSAISEDPNILTMLSADEFQITSETAIWLDDPSNTTYDISSTEKNEEDL